MHVTMPVNPGSMFTELCGIAGKINVLVASSEKVENCKQTADLVDLVNIIMFTLMI